MQKEAVDEYVTLLLNKILVAQVSKHIFSGKLLIAPIGCRYYHTAFKLLHLRKYK